MKRCGVKQFVGQATHAPTPHGGGAKQTPSDRCVLQGALPDIRTEI